ncbi:MAG: phosphatidylserine decarboxylase [Clostridia bacterium]|nr:phosphatidylserine decarboxylase [Clostridia bacterium]
MGLGFLYNTIPGRILLKPLASRPVSRLCGRFMDSSFSRILISGFIRRNGIDLDEYESRDYTCFNDCFCRRIRSECRPIDMNPGHLIAPCDGLLSAYRISGNTVLPVKQCSFTIESLLRDASLASEFDEGLCLVFRLCVDNYHRYCYLDSGCKGRNIFISGRLHTVRPIALMARPVFAENCREYTVIDTDNFGPVVQMEVGAMLVGKISNLHGEGRVTRGEEKGHFSYGGSTIIVLIKKDRAELAPEFLSAAESDLEMPVKMGQQLGAVK